MGSDVFGQLVNGFAQVLSPTNLLFAVLGCLLGTLVGVLPGIGPTSGIALLLPITALVGPAQAIIMLAAIYYGAAYGGSTTAILLNMPGEVSSAVTALDGYPMARQGRAGAALSISAIGSFVGGTIGLLALTFFAPPLAELALLLGPAERLGLMTVSLTFIVSLAGPSLLLGLFAAVLGIFTGLIGQDLVFGTPRFTFGQFELLAGIEFIAIVIGLFALAEVFEQVERSVMAEAVQRIGRLLPSADDLRRCAAPILRTSVVGFLLGIFPGMSPGVVSFLSYGMERRLARDPERFGKGAIEGVAAAETSNNAVTIGNFIPLLSFGIPASAAVAVLLAAFTIYGLQPGPLLFSDHPDVAWTVIASMYVGNVVLLVLNLPLVGLWARLMLVPAALMTYLILLFSVVGAYSIRNSLFDVWVAVVFGLLGYLLRKFRIPITQVVLGAILGGLFETALRQSLAQTRGDFLQALARPGAAVLFGLAALLLAAALVGRYRGRADRVLERAGTVD